MKPLFVQDCRLTYVSELKGDHNELYSGQCIRVPAVELDSALIQPKIVKEGYGVEIHEDGEVMTGFFTKDEMTKGLLQTPDSELFGEFKHGMAEGYGQYV